MNNYKVRENESGFYIDYIYKENNNKKCLSLREDNDYFSFSLFSPFEKLNDIHTINIDSNSVMFKPIKKLIENNDYVEILEEGTNEGKSIILQKNNNSINMVFKLTSIPSNVTSISITNVRLASPNVLFGIGSPEISDFKNKLHSCLLEIKNTLEETISVK